MSSDIPEELAAYLTVKLTIVYPIASLSAVYFVYGFYGLLFGTSIYMMRNRHKVHGKNNRFYLLLTVALFILVTIFVVVDTADMIRDTIFRFNTVETGNYLPFLGYLRNDTAKTASYFLIIAVPILLNFTADCMLLHRCYVLWRPRKLVGLLLVAILFIVTAIGIVGAVIIIIGARNTSIESNRSLIDLGNKIDFANNVAAVVFNSLLTLSTAGRIIWIHRQVRSRGIHTTDNFMSPVTRIVLESGLLYPISTIAALIVSGNFVSIPFDLTPIPVFAAGIAPTLIIVRAQLGKNIESLQEAASDARFTSHIAPQEEFSFRSQAQVHSVVRFEDRNEEPMNGRKEEVLV
ncbi:hypothetical protein WG66_005591 [Moniliophthora roreri]|uniref:Uncharacterized protein n=1 Tax=Moniliophthora roreri TaxID=221103 RepID=A0A0W0FAF8_MONRR|nr:hypothetical protein WG66_005591 [Moniliophthora roreri]